MKAVIVGGGIGGLAAGLALRRTGWEVEVLEKAPEISEVGAGLQISPNGYRVLNALGLGEAVRAAAYEPEALRWVKGDTGAALLRLPLGQTARRRWGAPYLLAHRADLIETLRAALEAEAPGAIRTGAEAIAASGAGTSAAVRLASDETVEGDIIIGADGVRSLVRSQLIRADDPRFTGYVAWRAVAPRAALGDLDVPPGPCVWTGERRHAVTYPLRGGELVNFVGVVEEKNWREEGWSIPGDRDEALALFAGWSPLLGKILTAAETLNRWALYDRRPLRRWSAGRVALVGDAAHPMLPSLAQGAVQALEDAWVLAEELQRNDPETAFGWYFTRRSGRARRVQEEAMENIRRFHQRGALRRSVYYHAAGKVANAAPWWFHKRLDWLYGSDLTAGR